MSAVKRHGSQKPLQHTNNSLLRAKVSKKLQMTLHLTFKYDREWSKAPSAMTSSLLLSPAALVEAKNPVKSKTSCFNALLEDAVELRRLERVVREGVFIFNRTKHRFCIKMIATSATQYFNQHTMTTTTHSDDNTPNTPSTAGTPKNTIAKLTSLPTAQRHQTKMALPTANCTTAPRTKTQLKLNAQKNPTGAHTNHSHSQKN